MNTIHITTGDIDGIGLETSIKALSKLGPQKNTQFILWRSAKINKEIFKQLDKNFNRLSINEKIFFKNSYKDKKENILIDIVSSPTPTQWVVKATKNCLQNKKTTALVTGPLSKIQMKKENFQEKGHTELLKKLSLTDYVFMTFLGEFFNVILLTGHVPLKKVKWNEKKLNKCIQLCWQIKNHLPINKQNKKLAILAFNPHAGEEGLLGTEEITLSRTIKKWKHKVEGPLIPDAAFFKENWKKYLIYICLYHDQALIPFKMIHERKSFQLSLGLPFIRTSVSHGTAKDIFEQNKADAVSMRQALLWAVQSLNTTYTLSKNEENIV